MNSTRLVSSLASVALVAGLVSLVRGDLLATHLLGAVLVSGAALALSRHFWRQGDQRVKRESANLRAEIHAQNEWLASAFRQVQENSEMKANDLTDRIDVFTRGVLEHVAQLQIEVGEQGETLDRVRSDKADLTRRLELSERRINRATDDAVRQLSGIAALYSVLGPSVPYPEFGGWAISGDCAQLLVARILTKRPQLVVEAGSGLSTVLIAQTLQRIGGEGSLVALEHDKSWLEHTRCLIAEHGVEEQVRLLHAPLVETTIGDETFQWYDLGEVDIPGQIDLVFVDGPPKATGHLARYPALPLLYDRLAGDGLLLMDDASRPEEREAVDRWHAEHPDLSITFHKNTKGTAEIRKGP